MITVEEALEKILAAVDVLQPERKEILECLGQVLAEDVVSKINIPPHNNSAMDGYAVKFADTRGASARRPVYLELIGEVAAGHVPAKAVKPGTAVRIMTGAPLPAGADAVVRFEDTDEVKGKGRGKGSRIGILQPARRGQNIRLKGEDIRAGQAVLSKGTLLRPAQIGILASLGRHAVRVIRRPIVSVLPTGDELCDIDQPLAPGKIYDSNSYAIAASILSCGGIPRLLNIGRDTIASLKRTIKSGLDADMLITSGGVSAGDYDVVKDVLGQMGKINFWTVRMKPGKPLAFGVIRSPRRGRPRPVPHLGLPGNPVSSMITFELFARPAILKMLGIADYARPVITAVLDQEITNSDGRRVFARVHLKKKAGRWHASLTGPQGSGILMSMAVASGLAIVPETRARLKPGERVKVYLLEGSEGLQ